MDETNFIPVPAFVTVQDVIATMRCSRTVAYEHMLAALGRKPAVEARAAAGYVPLALPGAGHAWRLHCCRPAAEPGGVSPGSPLTLPPLAAAGPPARLPCRLPMEAAATCPAPPVRSW